jgi:amidase
MGVQLIGRPADEATLLGLAAQLEAAYPWHHQRPDLAVEIATTVKDARL